MTDRSTSRAPRVLGADVASAQWVGVVLTGEDVHAVTAPAIGELLERAAAGGAVDVVGVDIPIGLPDAGPRAADLLARRAVGARASSVFPTPVRRAVEAEDYAEAGAISRELTTGGLSKQAHALRAKILEVEGWLPRAGATVVEVHPEVSFVTLAQVTGLALDHRKKSWAGAEERRALLRAAGIELPADLGPAGAVAAVDDVLDAAAAAWSAQRVALGRAQSLPDPPQVFSDGWPAAIWA